MHHREVAWLVVSMTAVVVTGGCSPGPDFDGLYQVESYTLNETACDEPGPEIDREFPMFRVRERKWGGVTIYPVYPCFENGECADDNDATWSLVTVEKDLDQVSATMTASIGDTCVLGSIDLVIDGVDDEVVLEERTYQLALEPYDPATCTTSRAEAMRDDMECVRLRQLVGALVDTM